MVKRTKTESGQKQYRIVWARDHEAGCFFIYADSPEQAKLLAEVVLKDASVLLVAPFTPKGEDK